MRILFRQVSSRQRDHEPTFFYHSIGNPLNLFYSSAANIREIEPMSKKVFIWNLLSVGFLLFFAEFLSYSYLRREYQNAYDIHGRMIVGNSGLVYATLDPLLGWNILSTDDVSFFPSRESREIMGASGIVTLRSRPEGRTEQALGDDDVTPLKIFLLGGSTTDQTAIFHNWPAPLTQRLGELGHDVIVFNGGVSSFGVAKELLKLIRDGLPLKPDLILTYNGVNEFESEDGYPFFSSWEKYFFDDVIKMRPPFLPNFSTLVNSWLGRGPW